MAEVKITGNLAADAEMRFTPSGVAVLKFRMGDSKSRKLDNGDWETVATTWYNVDLWDGAELFAPMLTKGARVTVYGEFYQREYEGKNGRGVSNDVRANAITVHPPKGQRSPQPAQSEPIGNGWGNVGGYESEEVPF